MTTQLHPLPFFKGAYWVDNSSFDDWLECARQYEYATICGRVNAFSKAALNYGSAIHAALAALEVACGADYTKASESGVDRVLEDYFEANPQPLEDHRQLALAKQTMKRYVSTYQIEPWKVVTDDELPVIERLLYAPLGIEFNGIPVNYYGLIDLLVSKPDGLWPVDHKTTSMLGSTFDYDMAVSNQFRGYMWLIEKCFNEKPVGYIINAIRSLTPSATAMKSPDALAKWWSEQFRRLPFYRDEDSVTEWHMTLLDNLGTMFKQFKAGFFPVNRKSCAGKYRCQFYDICTIPRHQRLIALSSNMFVDNDWTVRTLKGKV